MNLIDDIISLQLGYFSCRLGLLGQLRYYLSFPKLLQTIIEGCYITCYVTWLWSPVLLCKEVLCEDREKAFLELSP